MGFSISQVLKPYCFYYRFYFDLGFENIVIAVLRIQKRK